MLPIGQMLVLLGFRILPKLLTFDGTIQPFQLVNPDTFYDPNLSRFDLIDGASNIENTPLGPLFIKARGVDVAIALEGSVEDPHLWLWPK